MGSDPLLPCRERDERAGGSPLWPRHHRGHHIATNASRSTGGSNTSTTDSATCRGLTTSRGRLILDTDPRRDDHLGLSPVLLVGGSDGATRSTERPRNPHSRGRQAGAQSRPSRVRASRSGVSAESRARSSRNSGRAPKVTVGALAGSGDLGHLVEAHPSRPHRRAAGRGRSQLRLTRV